MADQNLEILIEAKDKATPELQKLDKSLKDVEKTTGKVSTGVGETGLGFGKMAGAVGLGTIAAQGAVAAFSSLGGFLKSTVTEALAAQSAWAGYEQILKSGAGASSEQINMLKLQADELERVGVISGEVIMATQGTLATFDLQAESIRKLTPAFVDMIAKERGMNATTQDAVAMGNAFGKVLMGNVGALSDYGFKFDEATAKILKTGTETEKITAMTELLDSTYKGMNETLGETVEGKMKRLDNAIGDVKENIGNSLLPTLDLFITTATDAANQVKDTTEKSDKWARVVYTVGSVVKAVGFILLGVARIIGTFALAMTSAAIVAFNFAKDVGNSFENVRKAASSIFEAFKKGAVGDFKGAAALLGSSLQTIGSGFSNTQKAVTNMDASIKSAMGGAMDSFAEAGRAVQEGVLQTQFKAIAQVSAGAEERVKESFGGMGGAASKAGDKFKEAAKKLTDSSKEIANSLSEVTKDYIKRSSDMFEAFQKKTADINKQIADQNQQYEKDTADAKKKYLDEALTAYIGHQDTVAALNKKIAQQEKDQASGKVDSSDTTLADLKAELEAEKTLISQYVGEFTDIEKLASEERKKTDLDRMKAKFEEENKARQDEHTKRLADLQAKMDEEKALYEKNKQELIDQTVDKYAKIGEKLNEGWAKMKEDTTGHVKEMKALEEQVLAIKASIEAARNAVKSGSVGGSTAGIQARANGGPVVAGRPYLVGERGPELFMPQSSGNIIPNGGGATEIHIMEGAQISVGSRSDMESLADVVAQRLARVLQSQRNGLATAM